METHKFGIGDKVRISNESHWAKDALGTISELPRFIQQTVKDESSGQVSHHLVKGTKGMLKFYWVNFDEPQFDADGDGPYKGGEIKEEMLESVSG